jgi:toxin ParE1/3/4
MKLRWTATALAEVDQILSYIAADNPGAAVTVADEIDAAVHRISDFPEFARVVYQGGVRAVMVGRFDYRLFYAIGRNELIVRNVRSGKRRRPWET